MENKYQEALDELLFSANHLSDHIYECDDIFDEYVDLIIDNANSLQELVDKGKAFDIIKDKKVSVWLLFESDGLEGYNDWTRGDELTQEEFDYLREMLV